MAVPSTMADLSTTASSNSPQGSESPSAGDDFIRAYGAIMRSTNAKGSDIASASSIDLGAATGEFVDVTGTTTITSLGTVSAGIVRTVRFTGALTLTHNASSLILPGSANITTADGDCAIFRSLGSGNWKCIGYFKQSGMPILGGLTADSVTAQYLADSALGFALINGTITASVASNALTIAIKTKAGEDPSADDPVLCVFRNATLATGDYVVRSITAATSLVISSGSTLGTTSAVESQINVLAIDNAGTVELAVVNNAGSPDLSETGLISTSAEGGAGGADSNSTIYSTTARTNVAYRNTSYIVSTQATAGTWASAPTQIQLLSGPASKGVQYSTEKSLSGTAVDFSDIPAWAKRITILLESASTNGTGQPILQLGDAGGFETTGYTGGAWQGGASDSVAVTGTGFAIVANTTAGSSFSGAVVLYRQSGNKWIMSGGLSRNDGAGQLSAGNKTLSDVLNSLRLTALGSNSYDGGNAIVLVEG